MKHPRLCFTIKKIDLKRLERDVRRKERDVEALETLFTQKRQSLKAKTEQLAQRETTIL